MRANVRSRRFIGPRGPHILLKSRWPMRSFACRQLLISRKRLDEHDPREHERA